MKLDAPLFSLEASKQLGKSLIYKTKKGKSFLTRYNKPGGNRKFDPSPTQLDKRMIYNLIIARWQTFSNAERLAYTNEAKAQNLKMSGWNLFYKRAVKDLPTYLGLQGYWSFNRIVNGQILDLSGNNNHGDLKPSYPDNCPKLTNSINSKFGKAGNFDGIDDYVDCGADNSLKIYNNISVAVWIKPTDYLKRGIVSFYNWKGYYIQQQNHLIEFYFGGLPSNRVNYSLNIWQYFVGTYDGTTYRLYKNGILVDTDVFASAPSYVGTLGIGKLGAGGSSNYLGIADEVRIYNCTLGQEEIEKQYKIKF